MPNQDQLKKKAYQKSYFKNNPWAYYCNAANARCKYKNGGYYKKGIKNLMNTADFKTLWFRDKAWLLKKPSIHRVNSQENYTLENCRFIELSENLSLGAIEAKSFKTKQLSLNGKLIKIWSSGIEAVRKTGIYGVFRCANGHYKQSGGYRWEYVR